jgi:hypothetical protein
MSVKSKLRSIVEETSLGYRLLLAREWGATRPSRPPRAPWYNAVLQTKEEMEGAVAQVTNLGLPKMGDLETNWDSLAAIDCILANTKPSARMLDAGAELYSVILPWLFLYGYRRLEGINLVFEEPVRRGPILYEHGDITQTKYPSGSVSI